MQKLIQLSENTGANTDMGQSSTNTGANTNTPKTFELVFILRRIILFPQISSKRQKAVQT